jgi:hypothetical protein
LLCTYSFREGEGKEIMALQGMMMMMILALFPRPTLALHLLVRDGEFSQKNFKDRNVDFIDGMEVVGGCSMELDCKNETVGLCLA